MLGTILFHTKKLCHKILLYNILYICIEDILLLTQLFYYIQYISFLIINYGWIASCCPEVRYRVSAFVSSFAWILHKKILSRGVHNVERWKIEIYETSLSYSIDDYFIDF